ncbi:MAG: hypothetical protein NDI93_01385 [Pseudomonas sp.]|nr:hypothetical protein [Pseudomonas sp.]
MTSKTLTYKLARFNNKNEKRSLQQLLTKALESKKAAGDRLKMAEDGQRFSLINYHGPHKNMRVGEFIDYTAGHKQPLAKIDKTVEALAISSLAPPDKQSEFLSGVLYFGVFNNSCIISQTTTLRSAKFEEYINWLLLECGLIKQGEFMTLADHPPLGKGEAVMNAKGIEFHAPVSMVPVAPGDKDYKPNEVLYRTGSTGWDVIKQLLPDEFKLPGLLKANELVGGAGLQVTVKLAWTKLKKEDPTAFMDRISNSLRHIEDEVDFSIETKSGTITRDDIKLRVPVSVKEGLDGLIQKADMWEKMEDWLARLIAEKRIDPKA